MSDFIDTMSQRRFGFKYFPWIISSKTARTASFIFKINILFKIFIYIHHNLEVLVSPLLLLKELKLFLQLYYFVIPHLDQPINRALTIIRFVNFCVT
jgi:hypothetical protein